MSIDYMNYSFTSFKDFIEKSSKSTLYTDNMEPIYAHPVDEKIIKILNSTPIKAILNKTLDSILSFQFGYTLTQAVVIDQKTFPEAFNMLIKCSKTLQIPIPNSFTLSGASFNACTSGTDEYSFIIISSEILKFFKKDEALFVIGHECGHIAAGHMLYHTVADMLLNSTVKNPILSVAATVPLSAWYRFSEITADRAGLLCCGDLNTATAALIHAATGFAEVQDVDIDEYLKNFKKIEDYHKSSKIYQVFASHPMIPKRIEALRLFANSILYYDLIEKPKPYPKDLLNIDELNRQVKEVMK